MTVLLRICAVVVLLASRSAYACTVCNSENGRALRAGLFDGSFAHTFLLVMAPVPAFVVAVAILHLAMPDLSVTQPNLQVTWPVSREARP